MKHPLLAQRYARGLARAVGDASEARRLLDWIRDLSKPFNGGISLAKLLASPRMKAAAKREILDAVSRVPGARLDDLASRFLSVLLAKRRMDLLPDIAEALHVLLQEAEGKTPADVRTAAPLNAGHRKRLADALGRRFQTRIVLDVRVDPALLGGLSVRVGDRLLAGDLQTRLRRIRQTMGIEGI